MSVDVADQNRPGGAETLSVLIADKHLLMAEAVCNFLSEHLPCQAKGVDTMDDAVKMASETHFDLIFYDCTLPGCQGVDTVETLTARFPDSAIVLFSKCSDHDFLSAALKAGLRGYVPKSMPLRSLLPTVDLLKSGEVFVPAQTIKEMQHRVAEPQGPKRRLTDHEVELLRLIQTGMSNKEIGFRINSTENKVKMMLRTLYQKIGAQNRVHALNIAKEMGEL